jgi:hypothetical protein
MSDLFKGSLGYASPKPDPSIKALQASVNNQRYYKTNRNGEVDEWGAIIQH